MRVLPIVMAAAICGFASAAAAQSGTLAEREPGAGRPSKRDRRLIDRLDEDE